MRQINARGLALIKRHETLRLEADRLPDGRVSVGYGHAGRGVEVGQRITQAQADDLLAGDLAWLEERVSSRVTVELTDNEFSALVSVAFGIGIRRFSESTLLKLLNKGEKSRAASAITWLGEPDEYGSPAERAASSNRRHDERSLFLSELDQER